MLAHGGTIGPAFSPEEAFGGVSGKGGLWLSSFQIPQRRLGEPTPCQALSRIVDRCMQIKNKMIGSARVTYVHVTGGSLFGSLETSRFS